MTPTDLRAKAVEEVAAKRGFVQGVAWAIALQHRYNLGSDQMLHESGLMLADFVDACVVESDMKAVKAAAKLGNVWERRKRADNGDPDTIVPAPAPHKKRPEGVSKWQMNGTRLSADLPRPVRMIAR